MESNPRVPFQLSTERRKLAPPDGKPLIVHVVVNVEHWQFEQPMPRLIMTPPQGRGNVPDVPDFSGPGRRWRSSRDIAATGHPHILTLPMHSHLTAFPTRSATWRRSSITCGAVTTLSS